MNFSLLLPTRKRICKLINLCYSLQNTILDTRRVEILIAHDNDDTETRVAVNPILKEFRRLNIRFFKFERAENPHHYYNELFKHTSNCTIVTLNDDSYFVTKEWDRIADRLIHEYIIPHPDNIYYGFVDDGLAGERPGKFCCFPFISRKTIEVLGYVNDMRFIGGGADICLGNAMHRVGRVIDMREIKIDHLSFHNYPGIEKDELAKENETRLYVDRSKYPKITTDIGEEVGKLETYMSKHMR